MVELAKARSAREPAGARTAIDLIRRAATRHAIAWRIHHLSTRRARSHPSTHCCRTGRRSSRRRSKLRGLGGRRCRPGSRRLTCRHERSRCRRCRPTLQGNRHHRGWNTDSPPRHRESRGRRSPCSRTRRRPCRARRSPCGRSPRGRGRRGGGGGRFGGRCARAHDRRRRGALARGLRFRGRSLFIRPEPAP